MNLFTRLAPAIRLMAVMAVFLGGPIGWVSAHPMGNLPHLAPPRAGASVSAAPPVPDNWVPVLDEEFLGTVLDTALWTTCDGNVLGQGCAGGGGELSLHLSDDVQVDNGVLHLKAQQRSVTDAYGQAHAYTAGMISSRNRFAFKYGYMEARIKVPKGRGFWSSFYALAVDRRSLVPEIDVEEILGNDTTLAYLTQHYETAPGVGGEFQGQVVQPQDFSLGWHTFGVDWRPDALVWYVDGVERFRSAQNLPAEPMTLLAGLSVGANWNGNQQPDAATIFPNTLDIDYIKVWQRGDNGTWQRGPEMLHTEALDELVDYSKVYAGSNNLRLVVDQPLSFLRDASRVTRATNTAEFLTWRFPSMARADVRGFFAPGEPIKPFKFYTSPDNVSYTQFAPQEFVFFGTRPWIDYRLTNLPGGTNFLKVEFPTGMLTADSAQLAYASFEPALTKNDALGDLSQANGASGVGLVTGQNASFGGDGTRLARTGAAGSVNWRLDNLTEFRATAWFPVAQAVEHFKFYTSRDGVAYSAITPTIAQLGGDWRRVDYSFNAPPCTGYVRVDFPGSAVSPQLGLAGWTAATPSKVDDFYWFGSAQSVSLGVKLIDDAPANFGGDVSRFGRLGTNAEYAQWRLPNVRQVRAFAFTDPGQPILDPKFYASADNQSFTQISATRMTTAGNWSTASYLANVPQCMDIVRVEIPAGGVNGAVTQITRVEYSALGSSGQTATATPPPPTATAAPQATATPAPGAATLTVNVVDAVYAPLIGWTTSARNLTSGATQTQATGTNGAAMLSLAAGSYQVCETLQSGWGNLYPGNVCYWMSLAAGSSASLIFRNQTSAATPTRTLTPPPNATATPTPNATATPPGPTATSVPGSGTVTVNVLASAYAPLSGWTVTARNLSSGVSIVQASAANGAAVFNVPPGSYTFCETLQPGFTNIFPGNVCYWMTVNTGSVFALTFRNQ